MCKKPPGTMSAVNTSIVCKQGTSWPLKALRTNKRKEEKKTDNVYAKNGQRKETHIESSTRRRIFGAWLCSMGSAQVDYSMHPADGMLHQSELDNNEGTFPFGLELGLFLLRQA